MLSPSGDGLLHGLNILVVEEDIVQADGICACVANAGAIVIGPAVEPGAAVALIATNGVDLAVVDVDLEDGRSYEVAGHLLQAKLPFLFVTGYECGAMPAEFGHVPCVEKPFSNARLVLALADTLENHRNGA